MICSKCNTGMKLINSNFHEWEGGFLKVYRCLNCGHREEVAVYTTARGIARRRLENRNERR